MGLKTQAAKFGAGTPELKAVAVEAGAEAKKASTVAGIASQDIVIAAINLDTGATLTVESVADGKVTLKEETKEAAVLFLFWSVGLS